MRYATVRYAIDSISLGTFGLGDGKTWTLSLDNKVEAYNVANTENPNETKKKKKCSVPFIPFVVNDNQMKF